MKHNCLHKSNGYNIQIIVIYIHNKHNYFLIHMISLRPQYPSTEQAARNRANTEMKQKVFRKQRQIEFFETEPEDSLTYEEYELFLLNFNFKQLYERRFNSDEHYTEYEEEYYDDSEYELCCEDEYIEVSYWY